MSVDEYAPATVEEEPLLEAVPPPVNYGKVRILFYVSGVDGPIISINSITEPFQSEEMIGRGLRSLMSENAWISTEDGTVINCEAVVAIECEILTTKEYK